MLTVLTVVVASLIGANVFAAGVVAILHLWRRNMDHGRRVLVAVLATGAMPLLLASGAVLNDPGGGPAVLVGLLFVLGLGAVVSLPLAIIVSRKLGSNRPVGDTFA